MTQPEIITDPAALADALDYAGQAEWLALDTEFVREDSYFPRLCLIQVAVGERLFLIDCIALSDLRPLSVLLANERTLKVLHAVDQDAEVLLHAVGQVPKPLFDTQVAAALLGLGDQIGYAGCVQELLAVELGKGHQRTNWARRPLRDEELRYAADDVRHLGPLYLELRRRLEAAGRLDWLQEDCAAWCDPARYQTRPEDAWNRVKGLGRLPADQQQTAARLAAWREREAINRNRPRRWILGDEVLLALSSVQPRTAQQLAEVQGVPAGLRKSPQALLEAINRKADSDLALVVDSGRPDPRIRALTRRLQDIVGGRAEQLGVPNSVLAPRRDLERLARGDRGINALRGWRRQVVGEPLLEALSEESG